MKNKNTNNNNMKNSASARKPTNKNWRERTASFWVKRLKRYWGEMLVVLIFAACLGAMNWGWQPHNEIFMERDPSLSMPYYPDSQALFPIPLIIFLSIILPIILTFVLQMLLRFWKRPQHIHPKAIDPFYGILVLAEALISNGLFSEFLKSYVGRKRPNFFAFCDYRGYRESLATGNFTNYLASTDPNRFGNMAYCNDQSQWAIWQSCSSYPSGHASFSFCGYTIFGLLCIYTWHCVTKKYKILKVVLFVLLMLAATVLSWSRVYDYWHSPSDIFAGAAIGGVTGSVLFFVNFSFSTVDKLKNKIKKEIRHEDEVEQNP